MQYTAKIAVLLCELNLHITHLLRVLLQLHKLLQRLLLGMRAQCGLIQHVLAALPMEHTSECGFFTAYTTKHLIYVQSMRKSRINTLQADTVKTAVFLCALNRHITHFLRVLLQVQPPR